MSKPKFWGVVSPLPAPVVTMQAKMAEDAGLEGVFQDDEATQES